MMDEAVFMCQSGPVFSEAARVVLFKKVGKNGKKYDPPENL